MSRRGLFRPALPLGPAARLLLGLALLAGLQASLLVASASASAAGGASWWRLSSSSAPTLLRPGEKESVVIAAVSNLGYTATAGTVTVSDKLPSGLTPKAVKLIASVHHQEGVCEALPAVRCTFSQPVPPYGRLEVRVTVEVAGGLKAGPLENQVAVEGGEAAAATLTRPLKVADEPTPFGVENVELSPESEGGAPDTRAGTHPFQLTTTLDFNQTLEQGKGIEPQAPALLKDLHFDLPPGLVGNPQATPRCSNLDFSTLYLQDTNLCPADTTVGVALVTLNEPANAGYITIAVPFFNLTPAPGEPARFGFEAFDVPVVLDTAVQTGGDYSVQVNVRDSTSAAQVLGSQVVFWGEPGDPKHDASRGWGCIVGGAEAPEGENCEAPDPRPSLPLLRLPTFCEAPLTATLTGDSWSGDIMEAAATIPALGGCSELPFTPSIGVSPEEHTASTPTGLTVDVRVPPQGLLEPGGLAQADVRDTTVTLPEGVELNPSAANELQACSEAQIGYVGLNAATQTQEFTAGGPSCPAASKVGLVHIKTPLLSHELEGAVYLASPAPNEEPGRNPFKSLVALYIVAEDPVSGVLVKLAGKGELNEGSLRVATTFTNAPQVPFEDLKLELFGGPRGSVSTPPHCGSYGAEAAFTPWSGTGTVDLVSPAEEFEIRSGAYGGGCPGGSLAFSPGFSAQSTSTQAGAFTGFQLELARRDGDQALSSVSMHLPPGVAALLSSVRLCEEPQAARDECSAESQVGEATAIAGLGPEPYVEGGGKVFITGPYGGAPFGLEIVSPAVAGPFNLGSVTVRSKLLINPENASVTIVSDPLPTQLRGIPLQLKRVFVNVNRPDFEFNPTNCSPMKIEGTVSGSEGATEPVSSPFQVGECQSLPFAPKLTAVVGGRGSKANGTSLAVTVTSGGVGPGGVAQAGIAKVDLALPVALSSRLSTLQKACTEATFNANPASCSEDSVIGYATIHTPVLSNPLSGPAYLVSHGGAAFPDVEFVLQGEGITLLLDGKTDIKAGVTYSRFESAPDAPFTVFETVLPAGPHGVLTPNVPEREEYSLCKASLAMPTEITGQNGAVINQSTKIAVTGCAGVKDSKTVRLTRAQMLARALAACRKRDKHSRSRRATCEHQARRRYAAKKAARKTNAQEGARHKRHTSA